MKAVRYVGKSTSLPEEYLATLQAGAADAVLNSFSKRGNVTVRAKLDGKPVHVHYDTLTRDFLDLSVLVYIVDEIPSREKTADHWTRSFEVVFPVTDPDSWSKHESGLTQMLLTLAGDHYAFNWCKRSGVPDFGTHRTSLPRGFDAVCLFSGGIDSFLGAHRLLLEGRKVLLVGHQADGTAASAQKELAWVLRKQFPGQLKLVQFRVARSRSTKTSYVLPDKLEESHRARSFLFLGLGIGIANATRIPDVYMPENGLIALNPPLGKSRLGTLSTRTAHPRYLAELMHLLRAMGIFSGNIRNPFLFLSKTDMLRSVDPVVAGAIQRSVSCARPSRYHHLGVRHCGYCVPCIYRRVAMAGVGFDKPTDYGFKLFEELELVDADKRLDLSALVSFARRVIAASPTERELMVLSHGFFPLSAAEAITGESIDSYDPWAEMLVRWSVDFLDRLREVASQSTKRLLGIQ